MNLWQVINELKTIEAHGLDRLPVMCQCDHGQRAENVYCIQLFYRLREDHETYGTFEDMTVECEYDVDDLEQFVMIN